MSDLKETVLWVVGMIVGGTFALAVVAGISVCDYQESKTEQLELEKEIKQIELGIEAIRSGQKSSRLIDPRGEEI